MRKRDKNEKKQGYSNSDQILGRALMTPDELRRMDNDLCIIFEKGLKPVKAKKYYYFESNMAKQLKSFTLDHNDFDSGNRGVWRKFDPYNPDAGQNNETLDLKVDSLDDLFDDDKEEEVTKNNAKNKSKTTTDSLLDDDFDAPTLPQEDEDDIFQEDDIQKQLEAKFDELFGPLDDED